MESKFKFIAIGIVAADKPLNTWEIEVYPTELYPNIVGETGDLSETVKITSKLKDLEDVELPAEVTKANTITATWLPTMNNRATAPDVCKGETVMLYQYAGNDLYYWALTDFQPMLRKKETVLYHYSNQPTKPADDANPKEVLDQGYYVKIDTNGKKVQLHTSNNDGEAAGYDIAIDTAGGTLEIKDTNNNSLKLDSNSSKFILNFKGIELHNSSDELITVMEELLDALMAEQHIGNMGAPTSLTPDSNQKYQKLKEKITKFKG